MKHFFVLFSLLIFASCSGIKQISSDDITYPNWISSRPISNDYYIGIAKSSKLQPDYEAIAKQNSLADLSSEISVNLSSESIFHQVDKGDSYREEYQALIQVESKKNLEIVDLTGAGDLFAAGYLNGYITGLTPLESLQKGTDMSSQVIQKVGARLN